MQPSKGVLTRRILFAALTGLEQNVRGGYDDGSMPMVFRVKYGEWGEVGLIDPYGTGNCFIQHIPGNLTTSCDDVKAWRVIS